MTQPMHDETYAKLSQLLARGIETKQQGDFVQYHAIGREIQRVLMQERSLQMTYALYRPRRDITKNDAASNKTPGVVMSSKEGGECGGGT